VFFDLLLLQTGLGGPKRDRATVMREILDCLLLAVLNQSR
jgi:hypothetical protein